jgi:ELWxxDGT repeat protein
VRLTTLKNDLEQVRASASGGVIFTTAAGELYRFDGSVVIPLNTGGFTVAPNLLGSAKRFDYFSAGTSAAGVELWKTNGTAAGTAMVEDILPGPESSWPVNLSVINRGVYVSARIPAVGRELFVFSPYASISDGSPRRVDVLASRFGQALSAPASRASIFDGREIRDSDESPLVELIDA